LDFGTSILEVKKKDMSGGIHSPCRSSSSIVSKNKKIKNKKKESKNKNI
jgi:hypothetical protein